MVDPTTQRTYFSNTVTNEVSWIDPTVTVPSYPITTSHGTDLSDRTGEFGQSSQPARNLALPLAEGRVGRYNAMLVSTSCLRSCGFAGPCCCIVFTIITITLLCHVAAQTIKTMIDDMGVEIAKYIGSAKGNSGVLALLLSSGLLFTGCLAYCSCLFAGRSQSSHVHSKVFRRQRRNHKRRGQCRRQTSLHCDDVSDDSLSTSPDEIFDDVSDDSYYGYECDQYDDK